MNKHLDAFIKCNSLVNARRLVAHVNKHPMVLCMLSEDHAGQVRNAERMVESAVATLPSNERVARAFNDALAGTKAGKAFKFIAG
jgi:hypothetical protein